MVRVALPLVGGGWGRRRDVRGGVVSHFCRRKPRQGREARLYLGESGLAGGPRILRFAQDDNASTADPQGAFFCLVSTKR